MPPCHAVKSINRTRSLINTTTTITRPFTTSRVHHIPKRIEKIANLLHSQNVPEDQELKVNGWIRSVRKQKRIAFAALGDGSTIESVQAVLKPEDAADLSYGQAVLLTAHWTPSQGKSQSHELQVTSLEILGANDAENNPLQPKYQTQDFLRTIPHLRSRIPGNALLLRLRSQLIASVTNFFAKEGFVQTHTPIITSSDCEGAGEVFIVSSNPSSSSFPRKNGQGEHFFKSPKYLTVSAQLHLEALALSVGKVWTLSPTFRAEKSETPRHLSEFYMLEAEIAFTTSLADVMDVVENLLRSAANHLLASRVGDELLRLRASPHPDEEEAHDGVDPETLKARWLGLAAPSWPRITYHTAIIHLQNAVSEHGVSFRFPPTVKEGLQAEHERYLATSLGNGSPVFVTDYPVGQKPFYMSRSSSSSIRPEVRGEGEETAACFDLLVPSLCELVGGSLRIHDPAELQAAMRAKGVEGRDLEWYSDLRKYGSAPHGGFGLGFDRFLCYLSGTGNLKDGVGWPRWVGRGDC